MTPGNEHNGRKLTPVQRRVLDELQWFDRADWRDLGDGPQVVQTLRILEERGYVGRTAHGKWYTRSRWCDEHDTWEPHHGRCGLKGE